MHDRLASGYGRHGASDTVDAAGFVATTSLAAPELVEKLSGQLSRAAFVGDASV